MNCDYCKKRTERLTWDTKAFGCSDCVKVEFVSHEGKIHSVRKTQGGRLTEADAQRIKTTKRRWDGRRKPDPRWR